MSRFAGTALLGASLGIGVSAFFALRLLAKGARLGKRRAYALILCSMVFFASVFGGSNAFFAQWNSLWGRPYGASIVCGATSLRVAYGAFAVLRLRVTNTGAESWDSDASENPVFLSWHILNATGTMVRFDNPRVPLPEVVESGETVEVAISLNPSQNHVAEGKTILEFDLVKEGAFWFADKGAVPCRVVLEVVP